MLLLLIPSSNWFHKVGGATLNDLSANVLCHVFGITNKPVSLLDLNWCLGVGVLVISFCRYFGPVWCRHLYVRTRILKVILCLIGSQCSSFKA